MAQAKQSGVQQASPKPKKLLKGGVDPAVGKGTQWKKGQSGNPAGTKPGTKHLSTWIQELMNDENFERWVQHPTKGWVRETGPPVKAIINVLLTKAQAGDVKAFDALAKYGYGTKVEVTGAGGEPLMPVVRIIDERATTGNIATE